MTLVLHEPSTSAPGAPPRRRLLVRAALLAVVALVVAWFAVAKQPPLEGGGWSAQLDARPLEDGLRTTRYVLSVDAGPQVVLTGIRNAGPLPLTVLGIDEAHGLPYARASFRDRGPTPADGSSSAAAAAEAAVTRSSVTLAPGSYADVLVTFEPPVGVSMPDGASTEVYDLLLSVRYLGVPSTARVPLLPEPLVLVGADTVARLEREGRFGG